MHKSRILIATAMIAGSFGWTVAVAAPASACTGDPCDGFCVSYQKLPEVVQDKVFHSSSCPIR